MSYFRFILLEVIFLFCVACDSHHAAEYNRIDRHDVAAYESFIATYPDSKFVKDAYERIAAARLAEKYAHQQAELTRLELQYGDNSLPNEAQPYAQWYGKNRYYDDYTPHSEIHVRAPSTSDVIAIVRYDNHNGNVAGHAYVKAGRLAKIHLRNGRSYQIFFYYGRGWYPDKEMKNGLKGGFLKDEAYSKDGMPSYLENEMLTYELIMTQNGNFSTTTSDENEIF